MSTITPPRSVAPRHASAPTSRTQASTAVSLDPFRVLRRHMVTIIGASVFGIIAGVVAYVLLVIFMPGYSGTVQFQVSGLSDPEDILTEVDFKTDTVTRIARTEIALLTSEGILRTVINDPSIRQTDWLKGFDDGKDTFLREDALDDLLDDLAPRYVPDTNLFEVSWSAANPMDVPTLLNVLAKTYLKKRKDIDNLNFNSDLEVFTDQVEQTTGDLDDLQDLISDFVKEHNIFTLDQIRDHPLAADIDELQRRITENMQTLSLIRTSYEQIRQKLAGEVEPSPDDIMLAQQDFTLRLLLTRLVEMKTEMRSRLDKLGQNHASVVELERDIRASEEERDHTLTTIIERNLTAMAKQRQNDNESYLQMQNELLAELAQKDLAFQDLAAQVSEYQAKIQQRDRYQAQLDATEDLIQELRRVKARSAAERVRVWTTAEQPREKSFPLPYIIIPLGFLLVVGLTIGGIFLRELTDTRVKTASDVAIIPGARVLGVIPDLEEDPTRIAKAELAVRDEPRSVIAESYRQACTPIVKGMDRLGHQSLVVTSGMPGAGSTTVITNLASSMAASGKRALVIDANFRRPHLAEAMGESGDGVGLGDLLTGDATLDDAIIACNGIDLITAGTPASRIFERLSTGAYDSMMAELRAKYDYILMDAPPAVVAGDAIVLANRADAVVIVVRASHEERGLVARLITQFNDAQADLLGIVLNRPRRTAGGYFKKNFATMAEYASKDAA